MKEFVKNPDSVSDAPPPQEETSSLTESVLATFNAGESVATTRMTVDLPKSLHKRFKGVAQGLDTDMSSLLRVLIEKFVDEVEG